MHIWQPEKYLTFEEERSRPIHDLLNVIGIISPSHIVDLGCGPGNSTERLAKYYPSASSIVGIDTSQTMLEAAKKRLPKHTFLQADITHWLPSQEVDLLFANAVFQWIQNHIGVMEKMLENLKSNAFFALQMPDNLDEPSHRAMRELAVSSKWQSYFTHTIEREKIFPISTYYNRLKPYCRSLEMWHTTYHHVLKGTYTIVEWLKTTGLAPYLARIPEDRQSEFLSDYETYISKDYPKLNDGNVILNFPRLFIVCNRK